MYFFIFIKDKNTFVKCFANETQYIIFIVQGGINVMKNEKNKETNFKQLLIKICKDLKIKNSKKIIQDFLEKKR